jgi:HD-GYP domain-containing protein (c-di-GMP phosphodiesterase class II)
MVAASIRDSLDRQQRAPPGGSRLRPEGGQPIGNHRKPPTLTSARTPGLVARFLPLAAIADDSGEELEALLQGAQAQLRGIVPSIGSICVMRHDPTNGWLRPCLGRRVERGCRIPEAIALASHPDLSALGQGQQIAIVDDRDSEADGVAGDDPWSPGTDWRSRLTMPLLRGPLLLGFLVIHAGGVAVFDPEALKALSQPLELLRLRIAQRLGAITDLHTSLSLVGAIVALRDAGTGGHLERVAGYSLLIGRELERQLPLPCGYAEDVARFAPLHDVGKLGIPDRVLLKPGMLDPEEMVLMRTHVTIGQALIERLLEGLQLEGDPSAQLLREVVGQHHECLNGSGYPLGLQGDQLGLAGRIVAVADIYDSLTQVRPYKPALTDGQAVEILQGLVRSGRLDGRCVAALLGQDEPRRRIREGDSLEA